MNWLSSQLDLKKGDSLAQHTTGNARFQFVVLTLSYKRIEVKGKNKESHGATDCSNGDRAGKQLERNSYLLSHMKWSYKDRSVIRTVFLCPSYKASLYGVQAVS